MASFVQIIILVFALLLVVSIILAIIFELMSRYEKDPELRQKKHKTSIAFGIIPILAYTVIAILWAVWKAVN